jgi:hypothetical protein
VPQVLLQPLQSGGAQLEHPGQLHGKLRLPLCCGRLEQSGSRTAPVSPLSDGALQVLLCGFGVVVTQEAPERRARNAADAESATPTTAAEGRSPSPRRCTRAKSVAAASSASVRAFSVAIRRSHAR